MALSAKRCAYSPRSIDSSHLEISGMAMSELLDNHDSTNEDTGGAVGRAIQEGSSPKPCAATSASLSRCTTTMAPRSKRINRGLAHERNCLFVQHVGKVGFPRVICSLSFGEATKDNYVGTSDGERPEARLRYSARVPPIRGVRRLPIVSPGFGTRNGTVQPMTKKPRSLSEYDRAILRATLAFPGTAAAVFSDKDIRGLLGSDQACLTCPRCGSAAKERVDDDNLCRDFKCDACCYVFAKST